MTNAYLNYDAARLTHPDANEPNLGERVTTAYRHDALNRPVSATYADGKKVAWQKPCLYIAAADAVE